MNIKSATYSWNSEERVIKMVKMPIIIAEKHAVTSFTMISILHHSAERQTYCTHAHRLLYNLHIFLINFPLSNALSIPRGLCYLSLPHSNGAKRWHHCSCVSLYWVGYSAKSKCVCVLVPRWWSSPTLTKDRALYSIHLPQYPLPLGWNDVISATTWSSTEPKWYIWFWWSNEAVIPAQPVTHLKRQPSSRGQKMKTSMTYE